jgi:fructokinase
MSHDTGVMPVFAGIEAGGTKFVCGIGTGPGDLERTQFPTTSPEETIARALRFFQDHPVDALGIASFGPIDIARGFITSTPKPGWANVDLAGPLGRGLGVPVTFDTDVNGAVLGEARWGAARGLSDAIYLTIGTGIGGGALVRGRLVHGMQHPEMGHIRVPQDRSRDPFPGCCPYHGNCLEGLACGKAMEERWGQRAESLPEDHPAWPLEAEYLALGLTTWVCTLSPKMIILGGGVMHRPALLEMVRNRVRELLNGYVPEPAIVSPLLGDNAGVLGAIALCHGSFEETAVHSG